MYDAKSPIKIQAARLYPAQALLGEGAIWNPQDQRLYWVDIEGCHLHVYDPVSGSEQMYPTPSRPGTVVPHVLGGVLVAMQTGIYHLGPSEGTFQLMVNPITASSIRFNDGKCDPSGRFWVGTMAMDKTKGTASLYRLDGDGSLHEALTGVTISNGLAWSADRKTMYYIDTPTRCLQAFDYNDATGDITHGRIVIKVPDGAGDPDGMTIDAEGMLWIAMWGAGSINRYNPATGELLSQISVPAPHSSSCAFGGRDLTTLYITTARVDLTGEVLEQYPNSGDLFCAEPGVAGVPAFSYQPTD